MEEWPISSPEDRERVGRANRLWLEIAKGSLVQEVFETFAVELGEKRAFEVTRKGVGPITISAGEERAGASGDEKKELDFFVYDFWVNDEWGKYLVVVSADLDGQLRPKFDPNKPIKLRIDSGCVTGQVLHDNTCECREQMHAALQRIAEHGQGILISIPGQDGRGRGMPFKLATLTLQKELALDTVRASALLDPVGERDERTYGGAVAVLRALGLGPRTKLIHLSNNQDKHNVLRENEFDVKSEPLNVGHTPRMRRHLESKRDLLGHEGLAPDIGNGSGESENDSDPGSE